MKEIAVQFGQSLDKDEFDTTKKLLDANCKYFIGEDVLVGPVNICQSYEQNMIEGRKKLDVLEWGQSSIDVISNTEFYVNFTDYLTHKGQSYTHRCKQKLTINNKKQIVLIEHIHNQEEQDSLDEYYKKVGLSS